MRVLVLPGMDGTGELLTDFSESLSPEFVADVARYPDAPALGYDGLLEFVEPRIPRDQDFVLVAESFSGPLAIHVAASRPSGLKGLVLCASFASSPRPWARPFAPLLSLPLPKPPASWLVPWMMGPHATPGWNQRLQSTVASLPASTVRARLAEVLRVDARSLLDRIECPVLYLQATQDRLVPDRCWRDIASRVPQARRVRLEGPHFILQHQPMRAADAIKCSFPA